MTCAIHCDAKTHCHSLYLPGSGAIAMKVPLSTCYFYCERGLKTNHLSSFLHRCSPDAKELFSMVPAQSVIRTCHEYMMVGQKRGGLGDLSKTWCSSKKESVMAPLIGVSSFTLPKCAHVFMWDLKRASGGDWLPRLALFNRMQTMCLWLGQFCAGTHTAHQWLVYSIQLFGVIAVKIFFFSFFRDTKAVDPPKGANNLLQSDFWLVI